MQLSLLGLGTLLQAWVGLATGGNLPEASLRLQEQSEGLRAQLTESGQTAIKLRRPPSKLTKEMYPTCKVAIK